MDDVDALLVDMRDAMLRTTSSGSLGQLCQRLSLAIVAAGPRRAALALLHRTPQTRQATIAALCHALAYDPDATEAIYLSQRDGDGAGGEVAAARPGPASSYPYPLPRHPHQNPNPNPNASPQHSASTVPQSTAGRISAVHVVSLPPPALAHLHTRTDVKVI